VSIVAGLSGFGKITSEVNSKRINKKFMQLGIISKRFQAFYKKSTVSVEKGVEGNWAERVYLSRGKKA
jgi:hypothetical protein